MRAVVDCTPLFLRSAGVKTYLYHLFAALRRQHGDDVGGYPPFRELAALDLERTAARGGSVYAAMAAAVLGNRAHLPVAAWLAGSCDVFHATNITRNPPRKPALTTTLHDLSCWIMPEAHAAANVEADREFAARVVRRAERIIAVSESTRQDAIRYLKLPSEKIDVIHHGVDERYFANHVGAVAGVARRLGLTKPYVLCVGTLEPRKNLARLLDAWTLLPKGLRDEFDLVIAGPVGWESPAVVARVRAEARYLGYVADEDLPPLTAGAAVMAYPSLYEGFGFPVAQAMASRVPVVTSNVSCLPEVAGDGALYADPHSPSEIASALRRLMESASERARVGAAGRARAESSYRWDLCARKTWSCFERAAGGAR